LTANLISKGYASYLKITDIDVSPTDDDVVFISVGGNLATSKVFGTIDGGDNWSNLTFNLPNVPIFCIKRDASNGLYAGTSIGVYYNRNGINYWEPFYNGLPPVPVTEIELWIEGSTPEVWASSFGRGMWYAQQYNTCQSNLTLSGDSKGNVYKEAATLLSSSQILVIGEGNSTKYNTSGKIVLTVGFKAAEGSKFKTYTSGVVDK
jgi:ligand-binding sensor domain-containing protein